MHILDEIQARHAREVRELRMQVEEAGRRGYEKGHAVGLREGYSSRVLDQADQKTQLTDRAGYFVGPVTVEAEGTPDDWGVVFHFGADTFKLRRSDAIAVEIDAQTAIYDGPEPPEPDLDAARKALIEEEKELS